jgi:hypothetical protein
MFGALALACVTTLPATGAGATTTTASSTTSTTAISTTTAPASSTTSSTTSAGSKPSSPSGSAGKVAAGGPNAPSITLVHQDPLLPLGSPFLVLRVRVKNPPTRAAVQLRLHEPTPSSLSFADAIDNDEQRPYLDDTPVTIDLTSPMVHPASDGTIQLVYPVQLPTQKPLARTLKLIQTGVYAVDVQLVHCGSCRPLQSGTPLVTCQVNGCPVADSFITWIVVVHGAAPAGVDFSWVWQVASTPVAADGSLPDDTRNAFAPTGRLARVTTALTAAGPHLPITIAAAGETLQAWQAAAQRDAGSARSFAEFKDAVSRAQPDFVLAPWVPIDERAVHASGPPTSVTADFALEAGAVHTALGVTPERSTAWLDHADTATLEELRALGVEQVGMRDGELQPIDSALEHTKVNVTGSPINVLSDDSFISFLLRGSDPAPLRVQRFVAATALLAYDQPNRLAGLVLATQAQWQPDRTLVADLASALQADPLVHATSLDDAFTDVSRGNDGSGGPLIRDFAARRPEGFKVPAKQVERTSDRLAAFASIIDDPRGQDPRLPEARKSMLVAMSTIAEQTDAEARLAAINTMVSNFAGSIHASARSVTLTSASTDIPITFTNTTGSAVRLLVQLESDKLDQVGGAQRIDLPPSPVNQTKTIKVRLKTSGHFVVTVAMRSIVGGLPIGEPARVTVSSRVFGSLGSWLTYGALAFLALWWAHHFLRRRRRAALVDPTGSGPA